MTGSAQPGSREKETRWPRSPRRRPGPPESVSSSFSWIRIGAATANISIGTVEALDGKISVDEPSECRPAPLPPSKKWA